MREHSRGRQVRQETNGIQPFWAALPLLALSRLRAGQVLGYTAGVMLVAFVFAALSITFLRGRARELRARTR